MNSHSISRSALPGRTMLFRLAALALTVFFTASQVPAQGFSGRDVAGQAQTANPQAATDHQASPAAASPGEPET